MDRHPINTSLKKSQKVTLYVVSLGEGEPRHGVGDSKVQIFWVGNKNVLTTKRNQKEFKKNSKSFHKEFKKSWKKSKKRGEKKSR